MVLRGQGESLVRICEACKELEEASRLEQRYGYKNRTGKGIDSRFSRFLLLGTYSWLKCLHFANVVLALVIQMPMSFPFHITSESSFIFY